VSELFDDTVHAYSIAVRWGGASLGVAMSRHTN
jgi:hypothetical protein